MESPVVLDKPPEYHSKGSQDDRGFPFDDEEGGSGDRWSDLAARHPDIAARLRARPWARKRRSSQPGQDPTADDFVSGLGEHFNRFPFDDIPSEFREHFPEHFGQRHAPQERVYPTAEPSQPQSRPERSTIATQTEEIPKEGATAQDAQPSGSLPQYGLRNTVDLGQKTPADPSLLDADERNQRSMSAPPENRVPHPNQHSMGGMTGGHQQPSHQEQEHAAQHNQHGGQPNVRHIPIFVEGRDEPVINKKHPEPAAPAPETQGHAQQQYAPPPPQRQYFDRDVDTDFHHPNYSRPFGGSPFAKGFRTAPTHQPFAPHMAYQQHAAPQGRSQSPKPQAHPPQYTPIPVHREPPKQPNHQHPQQHQHFQQQQQHDQQKTSQQQVPPQQGAPPPQQPPANDPINKILNIQKDVLDLMNDVESFVGNKKDKKYIYVDEMLTRNLIKLDDIDTEGKDNIRQARKEAIKCIQKCIAVLEAKAEGRIPSTPQPNTNNEQPNFDSNEEKAEQEKPHEAEESNTTKEQSQEPMGDSQNAGDNKHNTEVDNKQNTEVENKQNSETGSEKMEESAANEPQKPPEETKPPAEEAKTTPKKTKKVVKKRDKSKDKNAAETAKPGKEKNDDVEMKESNPESPAQPMETDVAAVSSQ